MRWMLGLVWPLVAACGDKDTGSPSDSGDTEDTDAGDDTGESDCPSGAGTVSGTVTGTTAGPLEGGDVILYDASGSNRLADQPIGTTEAGAYSLSYGAGDYVLVAVFGNCIGSDNAITLCGDATVALDITLDCAR